MARRWLTAGLWGVGLLACAAAPAGAATSPDIIELDAGPHVHQLVPGQTTLWEVGATSRADDVESLRLSLTGEGVLANSSVLADAVTIAVDTCTRPWVGGHCPDGGTRVIAPIKLSGLRTQTVELAPGLVPDGMHILTRVTLEAGAAAAAQNESVRLRLGLFASGGEGGGSTPGADAGNGAPETDDGDVVADGINTDDGSGIYDESLPHTGFNLAVYGLLGALAVASGMALSRWAAPRGRSGTGSKV